MLPRSGQPPANQFGVEPAARHAFETRRQPVGVERSESWI